VTNDLTVYSTVYSYLLPPQLVIVAVSLRHGSAGCPSCPSRCTFSLEVACLHCCLDRWPAQHFRKFALLITPPGATGIRARPSEQRF